MHRNPLVLAKTPECPIGPVGHAPGWSDIEDGACNGQDDKRESCQKRYKRSKTKFFILIHLKIPKIQLIGFILRDYLDSASLKALLLLVSYGLS
jgi:hypothetical protein